MKQPSESYRKKQIWTKLMRKSIKRIGRAKARLIFCDLLQMVPTNEKHELHQAFEFCFDMNGGAE
tara:strand:+ start:17127 stop:17321 length:195 start_codon:yes stop_codon:yes gene_type:complete